MECTKFDYCNAPLCPMRQNDSVWYPDEEICTAIGASEYLWVKNQRKIARRCRNKDCYFTMAMLKQDCIVGSALTGLDPELSLTDVSRAEAKWLKDHPAKPLVSEEMLRHLRKARESSPICKQIGTKNRQTATA